MKSLTKNMCAGTFYAALAMGVSFCGAARAEDSNPYLRDHRIGYVETGLHWATFQTADGKKECPQGMNEHGPRENFKVLYPNGGPVVDTQLARESLVAFPQDKPAQFPYLEAQGNTALGLNLDGKVGPRDFTSPDGEKGIDNAFYRAAGCNSYFRGSEMMGNSVIRLPAFTFNRMIIEITGVDNLQNDDSVEVTVYRGRDALVLDSTSERIVPGGSQRVETHYGKKLIQHFHGKIENGVLITDPIKDGIWPWANMLEVPRVVHIHDMRFRLNLSPTNADGMIAGYFDVDSVYNMIISKSTHHLAYTRFDAPEFYWAMRRNADAYPNKDGVNTAISAALKVDMAQVFVVHPESSANKQIAALPAAERQPAAKASVLRALRVRRVPSEFATSPEGCGGVQPCLALI